MNRFLQVRADARFDQLPKLDQLSGRRTIWANAFQYPPSVSAGDILTVDFDDKALHDGLFLLAEFDGETPVWTGCRRFACIPRGIEVDQTGEGDWVAWRFLPAIKVLGRVVAVHSRRES